MLLHPLHQPVHVKALFLDKQDMGKLQNLFRRVIKILAFAGQAAHLGQRGHAHIIVVQPDAVGHRTVAGERAVAEPFLFGADIIEADVNQRPEIAAGAGLLGFEERRRHRPAIIQCGGLEQVPQRIGRTAFGRGRGLNMFGDQAQGVQAFGGKVLEARVARRLAGEQHPGVGDAPFVADQVKVARHERQPFGKLGQVGHAFLRIGVEHRDRAGGVQIIHHASEHGGDLGDRRRSIRNGIIGLEPAETSTPRLEVAGAVWARAACGHASIAHIGKDRE